MIRKIVFLTAIAFAILVAPATAAAPGDTLWCCEENLFPGPACSDKTPGECLRAGGSPGVGACVEERCEVVLWCCERSGFPGPFCSADPPARCLREGGTPVAGVCDPAGGRCLPLP